MFITVFTRVLLENLAVAQLVNKFPQFYGTRMFNSVFKEPLNSPCPQQNI
jgi:hypothetical protein